MTAQWDRETVCTIREAMNKFDALDYVQRSCDMLGSAIVEDVIGLYVPHYANSPISTQLLFREWFDEWFGQRDFVVANGEIRATVNYFGS